MAEKDQPKGTAWDKESKDSKDAKGNKKEDDGLFHKEEEKDGVKTVVSSVDQESADKFKTKIGEIPQHENLTMAMHGVPGIVDLTAGGTCNNDGTDRIEDPEFKSLGPNPMPNRVGNELTRIEQGFNPLRTLGYANALKGLKSKDKLSDEDKKTIDRIEGEMRVGA